MNTYYLNESTGNATDETNLNNITPLDQNIGFDEFSDLSDKEENCYSDLENLCYSSDTTYIPDSCSDSSDDEEIIYTNLQPSTSSACSVMAVPKKNNKNVNDQFEDTNPFQSKKSENKDDSPKISQCLDPIQNMPHVSEKDFCPLCFEYVGHFSRHLFKKHEDDETVKKIRKMTLKSNERRNAIIALRKKGNFILNQEKKELKPVRKQNLLQKENEKPTEDDYFPCVFCLGYYKKKYLWRHKKICKAKINNEKEIFRKSHLSEAQTLLATTGILGNYLSKSRLRKEVLDIMKPDMISLAAKNDPLICLYGESYLNKHKRSQMSVVVSNKMRELSRLKLALQKSLNFTNIIEILKPDMYDHIIAATKLISGYNPEEKTFKASSLALHLGTSLKFLCDIARKAIITKNALFSDADRKQTQENILVLRELINNHWCNDISSLANKVLNENKCEKPKLLPLTEDIQIFNNYISNMAETAYQILLKNEDVSLNYKILVECTLAIVLVFNRKRIGEVQFLKIENYIRQSTTANQDESLKSLSETEKIISGSLKRVVVFGKGSKPVPVLFTKKMQVFIELLLKIRKTTNIVPQSNTYVFANPDSDHRWISGASVLRKFSQKCGAKRPELLTSTRFRKQIATILQIMHFGTDEVEQIARFMGHTEKTHREFYRLTEDVYQTAKVAKVLLLLNAGKGSELKGKNLSDIVVNVENEVVENVINYDREIDCNNEEMYTKQVYNESNEISCVELIDETSNEVENRKVSQENNLVEIKKNKKNINNQKSEEASIDENHHTIKKSTRVRWAKNEKKLVLKYFKDHIKNKVAPKKRDCEKFISENPNTFEVADWVRVKTLVFNTYRTQ